MADDKDKVEIYGVIILDQDDDKVTRHIEAMKVTEENENSLWEFELSIKFKDEKDSEHNKSVNITLKQSDLRILGEKIMKAM